jgi:hypothetical protein
MRLAVQTDHMTTELRAEPSPQVGEPSIGQLLRLALDDVSKLVRAEVDLLKADLGKTLRLTAAFLIVVTAGSVLLGLTISMLLAALVLALDGSAIQALLAASAGNVLVVGGGVMWLIMKIKQSATQTAEDTAPVRPRTTESQAT